MVQARPSPEPDWSTALGVYRAALAAEWAYDQATWAPAFAAEEVAIAEASKRGEPIAPGIPAAVDAEMDRLMDARCDAEDKLLKVPAPTLAEFAVKFLICFDLNRDLDAHRQDLCLDARRLLNIRIEPGDISLGARLHTLDWETPQ